MNKRQIMQLIDRMFEFGYTCPYEATKIFVREYEKLNEPEKIKIPQFVADWIEEAKKLGYNIVGGVNNAPEGNVSDWLELQNINIFARAWLDGYTIEEEKKYKITLLNRNDGDLYLVNQNADLADKYGHFSPVVLLFTKCTNFSKKCYELTKKEVVSYDFGWVFDCPGFEIEEVEG